MEQKNFKKMIGPWLNYSSEQLNTHFGKVSSKVSPFCQDSFKISNIYLKVCCWHYEIQQHIDIDLSMNFARLSSQ